ncbi:hypothetical protein KKG29_03480, partial [Patescibacteria group bacterium]|nr:hypothetical protein [Patescibacteria group bacterium]
DDILPEAFAACREAARRTICQRAFDVQLLGSIVNCHQVAAFSGQSVQVQRENRGQCFSFAGFHFRDFPPMQND